MSIFSGLKTRLFPPAPLTSEQFVQRGLAEAERAIAEKDMLTTIPAVRDLTSSVAIRSRLTQFDLWRMRDSPSFALLDPGWPIEQVTWEVPTSRVGMVYMKVCRTPYMNENRFIVIVEARAFYALWRTTRGKSWGFANVPADPGAFPATRKWEVQAESWAPRETNPVPIATVGSSIRYGLSVGFVDGITRTSWLLHHGAAAFPVLLHDAKSAAELDGYAGAGLAAPATVDELMRSVSSGVTSNE